MKDDDWTIDGEDDKDDDYIFKHNEAIERYLGNPDTIIIAGGGYNFIFKTKPGYISSQNARDVEKIIRDTAIDYEYPFHRVSFVGNRIEVKVEVSLTEAPLERQPEGFRIVRSSLVLLLN